MNEVWPAATVTTCMLHLQTVHSGLNSHNDSAVSVTTCMHQLQIVQSLELQQ